MGIRAYVPLPDWEQNSGYSVPRNSSTTPSRTTMCAPMARCCAAHTSRRQLQRVQYRAEAAICRTCPLRARAHRVDAGRAVQRSVAEAVPGSSAGLPVDPPYQKAMRKRQVWVEPLFAEGKQWHQMRRFRLRRLWRVNTRPS